MTHWGWHWRIKLNHVPKKLCSQFCALDAFSFMKIKNLGGMRIKDFGLTARLSEQGFAVELDHAIKGKSSYFLPVERQACNYGGYRHFFRCIECNVRVRILYTVDGFFRCRKCLNLGYWSQRLTPSARCLARQAKLKKALEDRGGSLGRKPKGMHNRTFDAMFDEYIVYKELYRAALRKELLTYYPHQAADIELLV